MQNLDKICCFLIYIVFFLFQKFTPLLVLAKHKFHILYRFVLFSLKLLLSQALSSWGPRRGYDFKRCRVPWAVYRAVVFFLSLRSSVGLLCVLSFHLCLFLILCCGLSCWCGLLVARLRLATYKRTAFGWLWVLLVAVVGKHGGRASYQYYTAENLSRAT